MILQKVESITHGDLDLLAKAVDVAKQHSKETVLYNIINKIDNTTLWRVMKGDDKRGILVTRIEEEEYGNVLMLWLVQGKGIKEIAKELIAEMESEARKCDCVALVSILPSLALSRWYERNLGFVREAIVLRKEVHHG